MAHSDLDPPEGQKMTMYLKAYLGSEKTGGQEEAFFQIVREKEIENNLMHSSPVYNLKIFSSMTVLRNLKDENGNLDMSNFSINMHELVEKCGSTTGHVRVMAFAMKLTQGSHNWFADSCDLAKVGGKEFRRNQHYTDIIAGKDAVIENWQISIDKVKTIANTKAVPLFWTLLIALCASIVAAAVPLAIYVDVSKVHILIECFAVFMMGVAVWTCTLLWDFAQCNVVEEKAYNALCFPAKFGGFIRGNTPAFLQRNGFLLWVTLVFILFAATFLPNLFLWWSFVVFTITGTLFVSWHFLN